MKRVAQFQRVSRENFMEALSEAKLTITDFLTEDIIYDNIKLPRRATTGSAGYDFFAPYSFELNPGETIKIPTGIRVKMNEGYVLQIYPRSSLGFKYRVQLNNTVGIIDSDYYYSDNEGHIFIKITNCGDKKLSIEAEEAFAQGIFMEYAITVDDDVNEIRNGGIGSTNKN